MSEDARTDALTWSRVHPVTPLVRGWKVLAVLLVVAMQQVEFDPSNLVDLVDRIGWAALGAVVAVVAVVGFAYSWIAWRMTRYAIDDETIFLHSGVLFRQQRAARLDRIQGIDTVQPLLARLFGLTELKIEVAGGADSTVRLAFLRDEQAQQLRNELLARAAGVRAATAADPAPAAPAPERELVAVPPARVIEATLRSSATATLVVGLVVAVAVSVATGSAAAAFSLLPMLLGVGGFLWTRFSSEFGFRLADSPDGIRLRHGLLEARAQTVPPGRVQAVRVSQPLLWRDRDWWRVEVNIAGYVGEGSGKETVLLAVGDRAEALLAVWLVLPDLGVADPSAVLERALSGSGPGPDLVTSPAAARWLDPIGWRRNAVQVTERALLVRRGVLSRRVVLVPHERTQSIALHQGPVQRRLDLATVALHSTPGPVNPRVVHLAAAAAGDLVTAQAARARAARAVARPERWMTGPTPPPPPPPPRVEASAPDTPGGPSVSLHSAAPSASAAPAAPPPPPAAEEPR